MHQRVDFKLYSRATSPIDQYERPAHEQGQASDNRAEGNLRRPDRRRRLLTRFAPPLGLVAPVGLLVMPVLPLVDFALSAKISRHIRLLGSWIAESVRKVPDPTLAEHLRRLGQAMATSNFWRAETSELDPAPLLFTDETWAGTNMTRRLGRGLRSQRLVESASHGHWKTTPFVAALRADRLTVRMGVDGTINGHPLQR